MAYTQTNFKTKKALKEAVASGKKVAVFQPNNMFGASAEPQPNSKVYLEGPHYPQPHRWYAEAWLDEEGYVAKVK